MRRLPDVSLTSFHCLMECILLGIAVLDIDRHHSYAFVDIPQDVFVAAR